MVTQTYNRNFWPVTPIFWEVRANLRVQNGKLTLLYQKSRQINPWLPQYYGFQIQGLSRTFNDNIYVFQGPLRCKFKDFQGHSQNFSPTESWCMLYNRKHLAEGEKQIKHNFMAQLSFLM